MFTLKTLDIAKVEAAMSFASLHHAKEIRKLSGLPYKLHPFNVMRIAMISILNLIPGTIRYTSMACAAVLHDILENTKVTPDEIQAEFGESTRIFVEDVTEWKSIKDWKERKEHAAGLLVHAPLESRIIKLADLYDNLFDFGFTAAVIGSDEAMQPFKATYAQKAWYYKTMLEAIDLNKNDYPLVGEIESLLETLFPLIT